jgi:hypothetical protein
MMTTIAAVLETADTFFLAGKKRSKRSLKESALILHYKRISYFLSMKDDSTDIK